MDEAAEWVKGLTSHRAGRLLSNHLACVELRVRKADDNCATTQALNNERAFIHLLARSLEKDWSLPCGLPAPLPRFIAILNLSGERMLAYSDKAELIRVLCTKSRLSGKALDEAIDQFALWPGDRQMLRAKFVVLAYSLPWQTGTDAAYWHLSACEVGLSEDGSQKSLVDRAMIFSSVASAPFRAKSVRDGADRDILVRGPDKPVLKVVDPKQLSDFSESYSAVNLDLKVANSTGKTGVAQEDTLLELVERLKRGRIKDQQEISFHKAQYKTLEATFATAIKASEDNFDEAKEEHARALESAETTKQDQLKLLRQENNALAAEVSAHKETAKSLSSEKQKEIRDNKKLTEKLAAVKRANDAQNALHNAALSKHVATISRLEGLVAASDERLSATTGELERNHIAAVAKLTREHEETTERLRSTLESKKRIINQLSENNDRKDVEKASLQTHTDEQAARIKLLESELAEKMERIASLTAEAEAAAAAKTTAVPQMRNKAVSTQQGMRNASTSTQSRNASTATHHCASTQTDPPPPATPPTTPPPPTTLVPAPTVGRQVVGEPAPAMQAVMPCSLQAALDMLQEHVSLTTQGQAQPIPQPLPQGFHRPLPFPHFTPVMAAYQPQPQPQPQPFAGNGVFPHPQAPHPQFVQQPPPQQHPKAYARAQQGY